MPDICEINSYAKINLHLDVGNTGSDGFHEIYSIFLLISLCDMVAIKINPDTVKNSSERVKIDIKGNFSCSKENNLIYKAAERFMQESGAYFDVEFIVTKNIPEGAGLGGGSSNAASVLTALNRLLDYPLNSETLSDIADGLGSDVRFFMLQSPAAVVTGRGEKALPVNIDIHEYPLLLVYPGFSVKTGDAYKWLDDERGNKPYLPRNIYPAAGRNLSGWEYFNSFKPVLEKKYPEYRKIFRIFTESNAEYSNITGSGSAVFAFFSNKEQLEKAYQTLTGFYPGTWILNTLARKPLLENLTFYHEL